MRSASGVLFRRPSAGPVWSWWPILAVAAYLRLRGMSWGLPYGYQDPDEQVVLLSRAFRIAAGHLDPEFFYYPSLIFYVIGARHLAP